MCGCAKRRALIGQAAKSLSHGNTKAAGASLRQIGPTFRQDAAAIRAAAIRAMQAAKQRTR